MFLFIEPPDEMMNHTELRFIFMRIPVTDKDVSISEINDSRCTAVKLISYENRLIIPTITFPMTRLNLIKQAFENNKGKFVCNLPIALMSPCVPFETRIILLYYYHSRINEGAAAAVEKTDVTGTITTQKVMGRLLNDRDCCRSLKKFTR